MADLELAERLVAGEAWRWVAGMADQRGARIVNPDDVATGALPDLADWATAGALLGVIAGHDALTDVVREGNEWIVAVRIDGEVSGYAAESLGEAAGWALLAVWENPPEP